MLLVHLLEKEAVPFPTLEKRYGALLALVRALIGVVPNCDPYLEIWPTAFRTYNFMVPNLLNLPMLVWGMGAPRRRWGSGCTWPAGRQGARIARRTAVRSRSGEGRRPGTSRLPSPRTRSSLHRCARLPGWPARSAANGPCCRPRTAPNSSATTPRMTWSGSCSVSLRWAG